jgi:hypothetical protein
MKLSLDGSLKLSTPLDTNERSIPCSRKKWIQSWYSANAIVASPVPFKYDDVSLPTHADLFAGHCQQYWYRHVKL